MLIRLRSRLARRRTGTVVLCAVATLLAAAVVGHAPADAASGHVGDDAPPAVAWNLISGDTPSHHHDGPNGDLSCSVGEALCAIGIVLAILLLRRVGTLPYRVTWRLRRTGPGCRSSLAGAAPLRALTTTGLVRLQI